MHRGYIKLYRKFQENDLWRARRDFSLAEAWIDILMEVQHSPEPQTIIVGMTAIECKQGQSVKSMRTWSTRWHWSEGKVRRFLKLLQSRSMIVLEPVSQTTRITVCNYELYNDARRTNDARSTRDRRTIDARSTTDKNVENVKNVKNVKKYIVLFASGKIAGLEPQDIETWKEAYPAVDIVGEIKRAEQWLIANPRKAQKRDYYRFLVNWFARSQERGGSTATVKSNSVGRFIPDVAQQGGAYNASV